MSAYQLLGAKFCHDIATPINALGLTLEMLPTDESVFPLTQQAYEALVNLLNLYRILFARVSPPLAAVTKVIYQTCDQKHINYAIKIVRDENYSDMGKIITCLFFHILPRLSAKDSLFIEQIPETSPSTRNSYKVVCELSLYPVEMTLAIMPNDNSSKNAPAILLNRLLDAAALRITTDLAKIEHGARLDFTIS